MSLYGGSPPASGSGLRSPRFLHFHKCLHYGQAQQELLPGGIIFLRTKKNRRYNGYIIRIFHEAKSFLKPSVPDESIVTVLTECCGPNRRLLWYGENENHEHPISR